MRRFLMIVMGLTLMTLSGCGDDSGKVHVRIRNDSKQDWQNFWLGAGGMNNHLKEYGAIASGETTDYTAFEPILAKYRKFEILTADTVRFDDVIYTENFFESKDLAPGYYMFAFDIVNGAAVVTPTKDK